MKYELLADCLAPRFGNAYDNQPWTDEIKAAVRHYLLEEMPSHVSEYFFPLRPDAPDTPKDKQLDELLSTTPLDEICNQVHDAAIHVVPTMDQLFDELGITSLDTWPSEDDRWDAEVWLSGVDEHQLRRLSSASRFHPEWITPDWIDGYIYNALLLSPHELLTAWHQVTDPHPSEMTDLEWGLMKPLLPNAYRGALQYEEATRRAVDGLRYRHLTGCAWSRIPLRYGRGENIYQRHTAYMKVGVYRAALQALEGLDGAERLTEWLKPLVASAQPVAVTHAVEPAEHGHQTG